MIVKIEQAMVDTSTLRGQMAACGVDSHAGGEIYCGIAAHLAEIANTAARAAVVAELKRLENAVANKRLCAIVDGAEGVNDGQATDYRRDGTQFAARGGNGGGALDYSPNARC